MVEVVVIKSNESCQLVVMVGINWRIKFFTKFLFNVHTFVPIRKGV